MGIVFDRLFMGKFIHLNAMEILHFKIQTSAHLKHRVLYIYNIEMRKRDHKGS